MLNPYCSQTLGDLLGGELSDFSGFCLHYILCSVALRIGIQIQLHNFFFPWQILQMFLFFIFFIEQSGNFKVLQASLISKAWSTISEPFSKIIPPGISFSSMLRQKKFGLISHPYLVGKLLWIHSKFFHLYLGLNTQIGFCGQKFSNHQHILND